MDHVIKCRDHLSRTGAGASSSAIGTFTQVQGLPRQEQGSPHQVQGHRSITGAGTTFYNYRENCSGAGNITPEQVQGQLFHL
jgi:hypothetical protein